MREALFVCVNNVGRSQMGMEFYNQLRPEQALSAGTRVDQPGGYVEDWVGGADTIIASMEEIGFDINRNIRTPLMPGMLKCFELVVVMAQPETHDNYLTVFLENSELGEAHGQFWEIKDPRDMSIEATRFVRDQIRERVRDLVMSRSIGLQQVNESHA
jgi:protein-tyrosine-phosphatase